MRTIAISLALGALSSQANATGCYQRDGGIFCEITDPAILEGLNDIPVFDLGTLNLSIKFKYRQETKPVGLFTTFIQRIHYDSHGNIVEIIPQGKGSSWQNSTGIWNQFNFELKNTYLDYWVAPWSEQDYSYMVFGLAEMNFFVPLEGDYTWKYKWNPRKRFIGQPVPEPSTWAMMIAGFGLVGAALRQRTRARSVQGDSAGA